MPKRSAWILNFDADDELARGRGHTSSPAIRARSEALASRLGGLVPAGDLVVGPPPLGASVDPRDLAGLPGRAFCPTPSALAALRRAGAVPVPSPAFDVLRRVNHRRFCAELGQPLPGARFALTTSDVAQTLASFASPAGRWLLKRPFGYAGRGRRATGATLDAAALAWVEASLRAGDGLQVEPYVDLVADHALHGYVRASGHVVLGAPTVQRCDAQGAWIATERARAGDLDGDERAALERAAREAGEALARAGYFGPFGVDAYRWRDPSSTIHYNPCSEINARYSMGWAVGMADTRPDL